MIIILNSFTKKIKEIELGLFLTKYKLKLNLNGSMKWYNIFCPCIQHTTSIQSPFQKGKESVPQEYPFFMEVRFFKPSPPKVNKFGKRSISFFFKFSIGTSTINGGGISQISLFFIYRHSLSSAGWAGECIWVWSPVVGGSRSSTRKRTTTTSISWNGPYARRRCPAAVHPLIYILLHLTVDHLIHVWLQLAVYHFIFAHWVHLVWHQGNQMLGQEPSVCLSLHPDWS